jgi:hypothetical protein
MQNRTLRILLSGVLLASAPPAAARTWTTSIGRTFEAEFVSMDGSSAIFVLSNGQRFSMPVAELSAADQAQLRGGGRGVPAEAVAASFGRPWPREIRLDGPVACKIISEDHTKGQYIYESPGYRFTCDARVMDDALRNFAVMFEATLKYAKALPLSMGGAAGADGRLQIRLFGTQAAYNAAGGPPGSGGLFTRGAVFVPMESLGLKNVGTGYSLDIRRHNKVLVHELAHQLTPNAYFAPGAQGWFSEGLAEYLSITPYNWGYFSPDVHGNIVKAFATARGADGTGGRGIGTEIAAPKLHSFFLMPYGEFSTKNANFNYALGLLLTHYFFHMEDGGKATRIRKFLQGLLAGQQGETALLPLLGGGDYEKLESDITTAWARMGVNIRFGK